MFTTGIMDVNDNANTNAASTVNDLVDSNTNNTINDDSQCNGTDKTTRTDKNANANTTDNDEEQEEKIEAHVQLKNLALFACEFRSRVSAEVTYPGTNEAVSLRMGLHCGQVICGIMGTRQVLFDVWSKNVNIASRMESLGICNRIQCTEQVYDQLKEYTDLFHFEKRGNVMVRSIGIMQTFLL